MSRPPGFAAGRGGTGAAAAAWTCVAPGSCSGLARGVDDGASAVGRDSNSQCQGEGAGRLRAPNDPEGRGDRAGPRARDVAQGSSKWTGLDHARDVLLPLGAGQGGGGPWLRVALQPLVSAE